MVSPSCTGLGVTAVGVTVRWIRRAITQRRVPFVKIGHYVRFIPEELDAFVESCRVAPRGPVDSPEQQSHVGAILRPSRMDHQEGP